MLLNSTAFPAVVCEIVCRIFWQVKKNGAVNRWVATSAEEIANKTLLWFILGMTVIRDPAPVNSNFMWAFRMGYSVIQVQAQEVLKYNSKVVLFLYRYVDDNLLH